MKKVKSSDKGDIGDNTSYTGKNQEHIPCSFTYKIVYVDDKFSKPVVLYRGKNVVYKFTDAIFKDYDYCKRVMDEHFNKNIIISVEDEEMFQLSNKCWICHKLFIVADNKVRDHCYITGKYRGSAYWSCIANLELTKKVLVIFYYLRGYDSNLIMQEIGKFEVKVSIIPNGLEKYTWILQLINIWFLLTPCNLWILKNLLDNDFKYLSQEFSGDFLELVKQKGVYPYEYMDSLEKFSEEKLNDRCELHSSLKDRNISEKDF